MHRGESRSKNVTMTAKKILCFTFCLVLFFAPDGFTQTAGQSIATSFTLLFSGNVWGEYEPCG